MAVETASVYDPFEIPPGLRTFPDDRTPIASLYRSFDRLVELGWSRDLIFRQGIKGEHGEPTGDSLPAIGLQSEMGGRALWVIGGIHGEEPAGPGAIAKNIHILEHLRAMGIPVVVLPLCNPTGYLDDKRYVDARRIPGNSVGDSEHLLLDLKDSTKTRLQHPTSPEANSLTAYALSLLDRYPPFLTVNLHEDEYVPGVDGSRHAKKSALPYIYSQGKLGHRDPVALKVIDILRQHDIRLRDYGKTRFGQKIRRGIVEDPHDGSLDELLLAHEIIVRGQRMIKPAASSSIVVETPTNIPFKRRRDVHSAVLRSLPDLWEMANHRH